MRVFLPLLRSAVDGREDREEGEERLYRLPSIAIVSLLY